MNSIVSRLSQIEKTVSSTDVALEDSKLSLSYYELIETVKTCSNWLLGLDIKVVALYGQNSVDWVVFDLACQEANIVCIPLPTFFSADQIGHYLLEVGAKLLISDQTTDSLLVDGGFTFNILNDDFLTYKILFKVYHILNIAKVRFPTGTQKVTFTFGSTGKAKGVCLSTEHQWQIAQSLADVIEPKNLCLLPLATLLENIAGIYSPLLCAGHIVLANAADSGLSDSSKLNLQQLLNCIDKHQPASLILIPQLLSALLMACKQSWQPSASLKFIAVGGAKVSADLMTTAHNYNLPVFQGYGLSECASVVALNTAKDLTSVNTVGRVLPHCKVSVEEGNVFVKGSCHLGYLSEPKNWYPTIIDTGDVGTLKNGFLSIEGRTKNILISGSGRNICPEWVESELMSSALLNQCMVVGEGKPYLVALLVTSNKLSKLINLDNLRLPDYARVLSWRRISENSFNQYLTANGRLQRQQIMQAFTSEIENCFQSNIILDNQKISLTR